MHNNNNTPLHPDENRRLSELKEYQIIDTSEEEDFESLTRLASKICDTPIALITLLDETRQWFKSKQGLEVPETPREHAFCSYAIVEPTGVLEVEDARADLRFHENPLVNSDPNIVFYAGISLLTPTGMPLGTLCVIDRVPRTLSAGQLDSLSILAKQVMAQMELRKKVRMLDESNRQLTESNEFMQRFATTAAHDLKNPLSGIHMSAELMMRFLKGSEDQRLLSLASTNLTSAKKLVKMVNDMLEYSLRPEILSSSRSEINFYDFLDRTIAMINIPDHVFITYPQENLHLKSSEIALQQIFINLLTNAVRYNDKADCRIEINGEISEGKVHFTVADNGPGIANEALERIFEKNVTLNSSDRFEQKSTGIGLHTVRLLTGKLGGAIRAESEEGQGSKFIFSVSFL